MWAYLYTSLFELGYLIKCRRLEAVENFKFLGSIISNMRDKNISLASKAKLMRRLILSIFLYAWKSRDLTTDLGRRIQSTEMRCYQRLLNISYKDHLMNKEVRIKIRDLIGVHDYYLSIVNLRWYGRASRLSSMSKKTLQRIVKEAGRKGGQKKWCEDNIKKWTGLRTEYSLRAAEDKERWLSVATKAVVPPTTFKGNVLNWTELK